MAATILSRINEATKSKFVRSAFVLVGGTAAAQALTVLALPILTRLYSPEQFDALAVYVAILSMIQVLACMRLDIAIPLPTTDGQAANVLALALLSAVSVAAVVGGLLLVFGSALFTAIDQPELQQNGWLLPFGIWLAGSYAALQFWNTRKSRFPAIARTRLAQAGTGLTAQLGLAGLGAGAIGLMFGHALMAGAGVASLARQVWKQDRSAVGKVTPKRMWHALGRYRRFPLYSTWDALANNAAIQLPVLIIAALAVGPEAGFVLLAARAVGTPVTLIGGSLAQVYVSQAADKRREGRLGQFTGQIVQGLCKVGIGPLVFLAVVAPSAFAIVFGEEWRRAGELVAWMTPWFLLKLLSSPISNVMHVLAMQRAMLFLMVTGLVIRVGITLLAYHLDPHFIAEGYALSGAAFYAIAFVVYVSVSGAGWKVLRDLMTAAVLTVPLAMAAGCIANFLLSRIF